MSGLEMDQDWLGLPLDSSNAPFGVGITQGFGGFLDDDLNFIWNTDI